MVEWGEELRSLDRSTVAAHEAGEDRPSAELTAARGQLVPPHALPTVVGFDASDLEMMASLSSAPPSGAREELLLLRMAANYRRDVGQPVPLGLLRRLESAAEEVHDQPGDG
jgi:hypothetical protein